MTEHLHDLLTRAVPDDAPVFAPHALAAAARRRRARSRAAGAGLAAAVVAVGAVVAVTRPDADDRPRVARDPDPYAVPACATPFRMPTVPEAASTGDALTGVRLCAEQPGPGDDALVSLDDLAARVRAIDDFDPGRCAVISVIAPRQVLRFSYADGSAVEVPAAACSPAQIDGREVDGGELADVYLTALSDQRDELRATRPFAGTFDCAAAPVPSAVRPGRERITAGAVCRDLGASAAQPLTDAQLAKVADAWAHPEPLRFAKCVAGERPASLLLGTDHGDVIQVLDGCLTLTWNGRSEAQSASLPVSMAELGVTR